MEEVRLIEKNDQPVETTPKLEWRAPRLETLDFSSTESGTSGGPEGGLNDFFFGPAVS